MLMISNKLDSTNTGNLQDTPPHSASARKCFSNDIERATDIARNIVTRWGLSEAMGPINYGHDEGEVFLGKSMSKTREISDETASKIANGANLGCLMKLAASAASPWALHEQVM